MRHVYRDALFGALMLFISGNIWAAEANRITVLYDAFGTNDAMLKDWGFAALVEYGGKKILVDTGNNAQTFQHNVEAAGVDLGDLDFAIVTHRHLDHSAGLDYLLEVNPDVRIYAPFEAFGAFGSALPAAFYRKDDSLPPSMRYFDGHPPDPMKFGTTWPDARFEWVEEGFEVAPGFHILSLVSDKPGTRELRELSLAIETPEGLVIIVGCSHPGVEQIVAAATAIDERIALVLGGYHLPTASDEEINRVLDRLSGLKVDRVAPAHCTGEPAFAAFRRRWGDRYIYTGVGGVVTLP